MTKFKYSLSVFFPSHDEDKNISKAVQEAKEFLKNFVKDYEIIIVDNCSRDKTGEIANNLAKNDSRISVIHNTMKRGYGYALRTGFLSAKKDFVFYTDSNGQFSIKDLKKFFPHVEKFDLVIGYRKERQDSFVRKISSKIYNLLADHLFNLNIKDVDCAFKLCNRNIFSKIQLNTENSPSVELLAKARKCNLKIKEIPVNHYKRLAGKSKATTYFGLIKPNLVLTLLKELLDIKKEL